ncbi:uncharacterized protein GGS22DRAFT_3118 [Annulohypoxylon maeteangense]|uniref:uncharacterized protein n=1 Tax=Annulohypoxylon maeteangense TaxID=1927788 RepID=UPI0020088C09|nr:uncharacterized protein GGS22DRAFT_3118 [Annulohypoxylon maeteangense]KAI0889715.1 hypothetical protein GGS22DRAFT_3118 [Annulohypoxylon maeteangense]
MSAADDRLTILRKDLATPTVDRIGTNLVPPNTEGLKIIVCGVVLVFLTALWTYLRFWSLRQNGRACLIEDWFNVGAVALFYCLVATDFVMVLVGGMGYHDYELQAWHLARLLKAIYARQFLYAASLGLIKISVILMFMRSFFGTVFMLAAKATIALTVVWMLMIVLVNLFMCHPINMYWDLQMPGGFCGDQRAAFASVGIVDIANHLIILMLPLPMIWKLGVEIRYRVATVCIFTIGILALVFGTINLCMILQIDYNDLSYTAVQTTIYGASEIGVAIIVSNSPLLRPVFDRVLPVCRSEVSTWREKGSEMVMARKRKSTKSSGFTQMMGESQEDLELGNMGAHRARRNTHITVGKRPPSRDDDDDRSIHRIVVTSETIVSRDKGEL